MLPLRENLTAFSSSTKSALKQEYGLNSDDPVLLIIGGSQGARGLNDAVPILAPKIDPKVQFLHLAGNEGEKIRVEKLYRDRGVKASVHAFERNMEKAYGAADAAVARSGASTIAEILHFQLPTLFVPYPHAQDDHQLVNARILERAGCGLVVKEADLQNTFSESAARLFDPDYRSACTQAQKRRYAQLSSNHLIEFVFEELVHG